MDEHEDSTTSATRRRLLAGGAAVVGSAAGAVLLGATEAQAANGSPILAGRANTATAATSLTNSSTSGAAHGLLISTKGGYGFQPTSASNHGLAGITNNGNKAGVVATNAGPSGSGAALIASGRNNVGASISNRLTPEPALVAKAEGSNTAGQLEPTAIRAVVTGWGGTALDARSTDGTAIRAESVGMDPDSDLDAVGGIVLALQNVPDLGAIGLIVNATRFDEAGNRNRRRPIAAYGDVVVNGDLTKSSGAFRIDHPLDPANRYLSHSFVESPDMANLYQGVETADAKGEFVVELPAYFGALNKDFRYQLTPIGAAAPELHIKQEIADNTFTVAGAKPGQRVSWMVTGTRKDAWADAHRVEVETAKPAKERGTYLFPKGFEQPESKRLGYQEFRD